MVSSGGISFARWRMAAYTVHGIGHGAIEEVERQQLRPADVAERRDRCGQSQCACRRRMGCRRRSFIWPAGRRSDYRSRSPSRIFPGRSSARRGCWSGFAALPRECRLIVASSAAVYGAEHGGPISEEAALAPMSPYGQHKLMMEQLCRSYAVTFGFAQHGRALVLGLWLAICASNCCGICVPGCEQGERTLVLGGTGAEMRDWTDVRDVVRLFAKIGGVAAARDFRVINGGSGRGTTVADVAHAREEIGAASRRAFFRRRLGQATRLVCWRIDAGCADCL